MTKTTASSEKASQKDNTSHQSANNVGHNGVAQAPPAYGLDFVDNAPIQRVAAMPAPSTSPQPNKQNRTGLPAPLKTGVESLSGFSMDDVSVHYNSPKPAQLKALAYTQGTDIYVGPRQEKHLPHEAWHVVQQKQGRVQAKRQAKGMWLNDDTTLEQEADRMGAKALQQKSNSSDSLQTGTPSHVVQRKVGFELEMQVLLDNNRADAGYGSVATGSYFAIHSDHSNRLRPMTQEAVDDQNHPLTNAYASIIEIVTKPIDETKSNANTKFNKLLQSLTSFVTNLNTQTNDLTRRVPLRSLLSGAAREYYVSLDIEGTNITNLQNTDAYIQATVGLDIAQAPNLMEMFNTEENDNGPLFADSITRTNQILHESATGARELTEAFKAEFEIEDTVQNQGLVNLQGLISMVLLYIKGISYWVHRVDRGAMQGSFNPKNLVPWLSHTKLFELNGQLSMDERHQIGLDMWLVRLMGNDVNRHKERIPWLINNILTRVEGEATYFDRNRNMLNFDPANPADDDGPTPTQFIEDLLRGNLTQNRVVTDLLVPEAKQKDVEPVGPVRENDPVAAPVPNTSRIGKTYFGKRLWPEKNRRRGLIIEFRNLVNRLNDHQGNISEKYFPVTAWEPFMRGIFNTMRELNERGPEQD